jgi:hypothetical protein
LKGSRKAKKEVNAMSVLGEKEIRAYQLKNKEFVCPVCASDEEKAISKPDSVVAEDVIHDRDPVYCVRCKKKIE